MSSPDAAATDAPATEEGDETPAPEPDEQRERLLAAATEALGDAVVGSHLRPGDDLWIRVTREAWREAGEVLRDKLGCRHFGFLSAIDWLPSPYGRYQDAAVDELLAAASGEVDADEGARPVIETGYAGGDTRFQVFARASDVSGRVPHHGITLKTDLPDDDLRLDTWTTVYAGADWHEREVWEMYGITFDGHPFLRHLYLPGEFEGFPLRKDFPLLARVVKPWPGIVDVEPMPGEGDEVAGDAEAAEGGSGDEP